MCYGKTVQFYFPVKLKPININRSGTRREERLTDPEELQKMWILRKVLHPMDELAAIEFLLGKMQDTKTNTDFFAAMKR